MDFGSISNLIFNSFEISTCANFCNCGLLSAPTFLLLANTVVFTPNRCRACANSIAITPLPITAMDSGRVGNSNISSDVISL